MALGNWAAAEFAAATIKDGRRRKSLAKCAQRLSQRQGESWSAATGHDGRQALWRMFKDGKVSEQDLLAGHQRQVAVRAKAYEYVVSAGDTTPVDYRGHTSKTELGPHNGGADERCMLVHSQYVLSPDGTPLGVAGMKLWTRSFDEVGKAKQRKTRPAEDKESIKWLWGLRQTEQVLGPSQRVVVVHDAEGDVGPCLVAPRQASTELLVRAAQNRCVWVCGEKRKLFEVVAGAPVAARLTVTVPRRQGQPERQAELTVRESWVRIPESGRAQRESGVIYRVVQAAEEQPDEGVAEPIRWVLVTTVGQDLAPSPCDVMRLYTLRWRIERWHFVLKSGMGIERLQIERLEPLKKALSLLGVVAWKLMHVLHLSRELPAMPASEAFDELELKVLRQAAKQPVETIQDAVREIARLAGYQPYRGAAPPGVKLLWIGSRKLSERCEGWRLATEELHGEI